MFVCLYKKKAFNIYVRKKFILIFKNYQNKLIFIKNTPNEYNIQGTNTMNPNKIGNSTVQQKDIS